MIKNINDLIRSDLHRIALDIIVKGIERADPYKAIHNTVKVSGNRIYIDNVEIYLDKSRIHVIGFGKASRRMAEAIVNIIGEYIYGGIIISPEYSGVIGSLRILKGDHPIPSENTVNSSKQLINYIEKNVREDDIVIVLISGGGSALFEIPEDGVDIEDIASISKELMRRGADIFELNTVRKRLSKVKGGKLLRYLKASKIISLIISDVVGDRLDIIASGPTAPDKTTAMEAIEILKKYNLWDDLPQGIKNVFYRAYNNPNSDTVKEGDPILDRVINIIIASNIDSLRYMAQIAKDYGFNPMILTSMLEGEAREVGKVLASIIKSIYLYEIPLKRPVAILAGGETTVTVKGNGIGGRNQELCLSLAYNLRNISYREYVAICIGSDGIDGTSPAAGALIDGYIHDEYRSMNIDPLDYLNNNDSYTFFSKLRRSIITGYTGTNVNDFFLALLR
ncbi:glycerate 2-kinase [Ignisphaera aggregans DSM 17230]|uniref:Glycerate 2-kinase n=1 Tax=Ignisphaera aggregans (strain DSM 17230 / JCM 13409 / AQ1.S1) TaxID=583356 RepID=E0SR62_IGNAA|nr:glycerate 2-kinase [Ignisphaera aggregans DSM 17230]